MWSGIFHVLCTLVNFTCIISFSPHSYPRGKSTDEETETQNLGNCPKGKSLGSGRHRFHSQETGCRADPGRCALLLLKIRTAALESNISQREMFVLSIEELRKKG